MRRRPPAEAAQVRGRAPRRRPLRRDLKEKVMDTIRNEVRSLAFDRYSTTASLEHATQQAHERNYQHFLIVDVDSHHYESESYKDVFQYIESPVIRREALLHINRGGRASSMKIGRASCRER